MIRGAYDVISLPSALSGTSSERASMDRSMALLSPLSLAPRGLVSPRIGARKAQCDGVCRGYQSRLLRIVAEELPLGTRDQKLVSTHSSIFRIMSPRSMCCKNARHSPRIRSPANSVEASRDARPPSSSRRAGPASRPHGHMRRRVDQSMRGPGTVCVQTVRAFVS